MIATRRGFIGGLIGLVAAPAVIRVADLMAVNPGLAPPPPPGYSLLTIQEITRETIRIFRDSNAFLDNSLEPLFCRDDVRIGSALLPAPSTAAIAAAAIIVDPHPVSRRFWA